MGGSNSRAKLTGEQNAANADLSNRTVLITGANAGLGLETARVLANRGARVVMAARDTAKCEAAIASLPTPTLGGSFVPMQLDLSSLASVSRFATDYLARGWPLHLLICNAGVMATPYSLTADGVELQLGTNHLGHYALTQQLLPALLATAAKQPVRVVVLSSEAIVMHPSIDYAHLPDPTTANYSAWRAYGQSKWANVLFANELNRRYSNQHITAYSAHPGIIFTQLYQHAAKPLVWLARLAIRRAKTVEQGAATTVYCAVEPGLEQNGAGQFFEDSAVSERAELEKMTEEEAGKFWEWSEQIVKERGPAKS